jgi:hypothetical protein
VAGRPARALKVWIGTARIRGLLRGGLSRVEEARIRGLLRGGLSRVEEAGAPALGSARTITLRLSDRAAEPAIERLGELAERAAPSGRYLVADVDGQVWAALPLSGGEPLADPFLPMLEVKELLSLRVAQLDAGAARSRDERSKLAPVLSAEWRAC